MTPEEIVITRNTTEANNFVSSGLDLQAGDEVVVWADNHPSNLNAWRTKAKRFGFTVVTRARACRRIRARTGYVELFTKAFTPRTKLVAITHVSSNSGDLLPVGGDLRGGARTRHPVARRRRAGVRRPRPRPRRDQAGLLHRLDAQVAVRTEGEGPALRESRPCTIACIRPIVGLYGGQVGLSRTFEANGQRDDASIAAVVEG